MGRCGRWRLGLALLGAEATERSLARFQRAAARGRGRAVDAIRCGRGAGTVDAAGQAAVAGRWRGAGGTHARVGNRVARGRRSTATRRHAILRGGARGLPARERLGRRARLLAQLHRPATTLTNARARSAARTAEVAHRARGERARRAAGRKLGGTSARVRVAASIAAAVAARVKTVDRASASARATDEGRCEE